MLVNACKIDCQVVQGVSAKACHDEAASRSSTTEAKDERETKNSNMHPHARTSDKGEPHAKSKNEEAKAAEKGAAQSQLPTAP